MKGSKFLRMLQILINGLIDGLLIALVALGFHIIFSTTKIFHIAHGGIYVAGAYSFNFFYQYVGFFSGLICALFLSFLLGMLIEWLIYKPLREKSSNSNIALISSLAMYLVLVNLVALLAGNETKLFSSRVLNSFSIDKIIITRQQLNQILIAIPAILLFILFLNLTGIGLKIRALANNPTLASVVGIKVQNMRYLVFGVGSILAVIAALLKSFDTGIDPNIGMAITLSAAVVVIIGGATSIYGTLIGAFLLAIIQNITEFFLSAQWKEPLTFAILVAVLLFRTEGILQFKTRVDER